MEDEKYQWVDESIKLAKNIAERSDFDHINPFEEFAKKEKNIIGRPQYLDAKKKWCDGTNARGETNEDVIGLLSEDSIKGDARKIFKTVANMDCLTEDNSKSLYRQLQDDSGFKQSYEKVIRHKISYNNKSSNTSTFNIQRLSIFLHHIRPDLFWPVSSQKQWKYLNGNYAAQMTLEKYLETCKDVIVSKCKNNSIKYKYRMAFVSQMNNHSDSESDNNNSKPDDQGEKDLMLKQICELLETHHNIVLHGAPGTGKTYLAQQVADAIGASDERIGFVQFHPSYDYTDFVEGLRSCEVSEPDGKTSIGFKRVNGVFKDFCQRAVSDLVNKYVFIIDEINRGNMSKIFGELFYSIDPGYRVRIEDKDGNKVLNFQNVRKVFTQYQNLIKKDADDIFKDGFFVPENVYIIGTMNDIDRSVESMDFAFRRRFVFKEIKANEKTDWLTNKLADDGQAVKVMNALNDAIYCDDKMIIDDNNNKGKVNVVNGLNSGYHVGPAYFAKLKKFNNDYEQLWTYCLEPLLREYVRGNARPDADLKKLKDVYDDAVRQNTKSEPQEGTQSELAHNNPKTESYQ